MVTSSELLDKYGGPLPLKKRKSLCEYLHLDPLLFVLLVLLSVLGLFVLYSASDRSLSMVFWQSGYLLTGFLVMGAVAQITPRIMARWSFLLYLGGVCLLLCVLLLGHSAKGAQRWLHIPGGIRFQPSEIMKIAMPLTTAWFISKTPLPPGYLRSFAALALIALPVGLILKQPDLGTAFLILTAGLFALLVSGLRWQIILGAVVLALPCGFVMWEFVMRSYQKERILTFFHPTKDPWGAGWNIIQSTVAIGSGGINGKGWLQGTQSHLNFLPESHTDFILAVFAEEFGFIGMLCLLVLYLAVLLRGIYMVSKGSSLFGRIVGGSIMFTFFVYIFVNIGMVCGILPVVGVPLPLVSRGGTSIITLMAGFGIVMSVYSHQELLASK